MMMIRSETKPGDFLGTEPSIYFSCGVRRAGEEVGMKRKLWKQSYFRTTQPADTIVHK
jgi:hypothetical protein